VSSLPQRPVIIATELADARALLGDESLTWLSGKAVCLDLALEHRRGDPFVVVDLQETGWVERYTASDNSLAPSGEELVQAQMPVRPGESADSASERLEHLLDASFAQWRDRVQLSVYDNGYPRELVTRALAAARIDRVVTARDPVAHERVGDILASADLLFLTLPRRVDGSPGGRISAKTYEYLMTDRPILAAVPHGESWDFLSGRPGVWLAEPDDAEAMRAVVVELAAAKFSGRPTTFARETAREEISYASRGGEFEDAIRAGIARRRRRRDRS